MTAEGRERKATMYKDWPQWIIDWLEGWVPFIHYGTEAGP